MNATFFWRSSVITMEATTASYFLASSAGMMPSQSWATSVHSTCIFAHRALAMSTSKPCNWFFEST
ncbi:hypothetical protein D3C80_1714210 [compost metagenome]